MATIHDEIRKLRKRLQTLEVEQKRQDLKLVEEIRDFKETVRLEAELLGINDDEIQDAFDKINFKILYDSEEIKKLEEELSNIDKTMPAVEQKKAVLIHDDNETRRLEDELLHIDDKKLEKVKKTEIYVIRLIIEGGKSSEWSEESGGGWRDQGAGMHYTSVNQVKKRFKVLKTRWPDYPIKIVKIK